MVSFSVDPMLHLSTPPSAASSAKHAPEEGPSFSDHLEIAEHAPRQAPDAKPTNEPDDVTHSEPSSSSPTDAESEQNAADGAEQAEGHAEVRGDGPSPEEDTAADEQPQDELELSEAAVSSTESPLAVAVDHTVRSEEGERADSESAGAEEPGETAFASESDRSAAEGDSRAGERSERNIVVSAADEVAAEVDTGSVRDGDRSADEAEPDAAAEPQAEAKTVPTPQVDETLSDEPQQPRDLPRAENARNQDVRPQPKTADGEPNTEVPPRDSGPRPDASRPRVESPRWESAEPVRGSGSTPSESPAASETRLRITPGRLAGNTGTSRGTNSNAVDHVRFVQRVARAFHAARNGPGEIRLRLHPPELGHLRLEVRVEDGALQARMETETATAKSVLLDNLPALRERLAQQDIRLDRVNVDVMPQSDGGTGQRAAEDARPDRQPAAPGRAPQDDETSDGGRQTTGFVDYDNGNLNVVI